jgi:hypothetical protein
MKTTIVWSSSVALVLAAAACVSDSGAGRRPGVTTTTAASLEATEADVEPLRVDRDRAREELAAAQLREDEMRRANAARFERYAERDELIGRASRSIDAADVMLADPKRDPKMPTARLVEKRRELDQALRAAATADVDAWAQERARLEAAIAELDRETANLSRR